jgi:hypothetical protein
MSHLCLEKKIWEKLFRSYHREMSTVGSFSSLTDYEHHQFVIGVNHIFCGTVTVARTYMLVNVQMYIRWKANRELAKQQLLVSNSCCY